MNLHTLVYAFVATYICTVEGQSPCKTPSGDNGICKSISDCPPLLPFISNNTSPEHKDLLKKSQCGLQGNIPEVCCPDPCYTPDGQPGTCADIVSCQHLFNMIKPTASKEDTAYVDNSICDGEDQLRVCCGPPRNPSPPSLPGSCKNTVSAFPPDPATNCCGQGGLGHKITGGNYTDIYEHPWLAIIEYVKSNSNKRNLLCGGTLISGRYVLTAGYCVIGSVLDFGRPESVRLGEYNTKQDGPDCLNEDAGDCSDGAVSIPIESTIPHPDYDPQKRRNDIALIRLKENSPYTDFIRPICLPTVDFTLAASNDLILLTAGWSSGKNSVKGQKWLPFVKLEDCQKAYESKQKTYLWKKHLCAGGEALSGTCTGDGGGPLIHQVNRQSEIVGVVSFGPKNCASKGLPSVYTNVHEYNTWIRRSIRP